MIAGRPRWARRVRHRIGHRGATLLFFAGVEYVYAYSLVMPAPERARSSLIVYLDSVAPLWIWAGLWLTTGMIATVTAFADNDRVGFAACIGLKFLWAVTLVFGAFRGVQSAYLSAAIWLGSAFLLFNANTWSEPIDYATGPPLAPPNEEDSADGFDAD